MLKGEGIVQGFIWLNVSQSNIEKLDLFEGEYYRRVEGVATDINNNKIVVNFYLIQDSYLSILEDSEWDQDEFQQYGLANFLKNYVGFN
ncbi:MAG: gamma-glutamylcyclotransferase [Xenococcus sp. (in: cyanobacteria)]